MSTKPIPTKITLDAENAEPGASSEGAWSVRVKVEAGSEPVPGVPIKAFLQKMRPRQPLLTNDRGEVDLVLFAEPPESQTHDPGQLALTAKAGGEAVTFTVVTHGWDDGPTPLAGVEVVFRAPGGPSESQSVRTAGEAGEAECSLVLG